MHRKRNNGEHTMSTHLTNSQKALIETALYLRGEALRRRLNQCGDLDTDVELALADAEHLELSRIEYAQTRLEDDDFGLCRACGCRIPFDHLRFRPHVIHCMSCAAAQRKISARHRIASVHV